MPQSKKRFLAAGVAIPPYSGTTNMKPSDLLRLLDIEFQVSPQTPLPSFFSGDHSGKATSAKQGAVNKAVDKWKKSATYKKHHAK